MPAFFQALQGGRLELDFFQQRHPRVGPEVNVQRVGRFQAEIGWRTGQVCLWKALNGPLVRLSLAMRGTLPATKWFGEKFKCFVHTASIVSITRLEIVTKKDARNNSSNTSSPGVSKKICYLGEIACNQKEDRRIERRCHGLTRFDLTINHYPINRRKNLGIPKGRASTRKPSPDLGNLSLGCTNLGHCNIVLTLHLLKFTQVRHVLGNKKFQPLQSGLDGITARFCAPDRRLRGRQLCILLSYVGTEKLGINLCEELTGGDMVVEVHIHRHNPA